jgi:citrate synthase
MTTSGLDDVVVAETVLSEVDGQRGRLTIRGASVEQLTGQVPFEAVAARLWDGLAPGPETSDSVAAALGQARVEAFTRLTPLFDHAAALPAIDGLRLGLAALSDGTAIPAHHLVAGAVPVFLAGARRARQGLPPVTPDPSLGQAADFLRMLSGEPAPAVRAWALNAYLVTVAEHGMNASTFTARVIASTRAGMVASVVGALCALKGPLHGGAPGPVLDMLDAIGEPSRTAAWIAAELAAGRRLMGFGHRVYRVRDPRADALKGAIRRLGADSGRLALAEAVEQAALAILRERKPNRTLETNVEFYTALLLEALGFTPDSFTCVFALGRTTGWLAHAKEQIAGGRLIRPQSVYVGPQPRQAA